MSQSISCPHCSLQISVAEDELGQAMVCPDCNRRISDEVAEDTERSSDDCERQSRLNVAEGRLPPKFLVDDPEFVDHRIRQSANQNVLLPDGRGGVTSVKGNVVRIEHRGKTIDLIALPADEKRKHQRIINVVSIVLGIVFLIVVFFLI